MKKYISLLLLIIALNACSNSSQQSYKTPPKDSTVARDTTKKDSTKPDVSNPDAFSDPH